MAPNLDVRYEYPDSSPIQARRALREAAEQLSKRGLASASKWALELLVCVPRPEFDEVKSPWSASKGFTDDYTCTPSHRLASQPSMYPSHSTPALHWDQSRTSDLSGRFNDLGASLGASSYARRDSESAEADTSQSKRASTSSTSAHVRFAPSKDVSILSIGDSSFKHGGGVQYEESWIEEDEDSYLLAKSLFDHHQWERCEALLEKRKVRGPKALFLKLYARYLILERRSEEEYFQVSKKTKQDKVLRRELIPLLRELVDPVDAFLLFLKGILFRKLDKRIEAMDCFLRSLELLPYNWSAWQELSTTLVGGRAELQEIAHLLPDSFMTSFFCELFGRSSAGRMTGTESLDRIEALLQLFPNAPYLLVCKGQNLHLLKDLEASEEAYEAARTIDPHRLDGMADYSNSLFVQGKEEKLAHLTHSLAEAGREDAEVCCAVGNYHTLRGDNHRAVEVFKRAVRLDPSCSSAWILLGHAYIELKDSIAASEMYRKALELNPRDVRAWTGLGNTYELNSAWAYALHYHKKAAANSPYDFRFWASMANCYEKLRLYANAIECYKKILTLEDGIDSQLVVMESIARLYEDGELGNVSKACLWHCRIVELIEKTRMQETTAGQEREAIQIREHVHSYLIAARWEMGDFASDGSAAGQSVQDDFDMQQADNISTSDGEVQEDSQVQGEEDQAAPTGNLALANEYLQKAIMTGTEAALEADELLKRLAFLRT